MLSAEKISSILQDQFGVPEVDLRSIDFSRNELGTFSFRMPILKKSYCRVFWTSEGRLIEYTPHDRLLIQFQNGVWKIQADFADEDLLIQVCRTFWLSVYGLKRELAGELRLHAAGISGGEDCVLFWGPPGAGKTTLTQLAIRATDHSILSDELCLFDGSKIHGVPMTLHQKQTTTSEKCLEKIPSHRIQKQAQAKTIYVLRRERTDQCRIEELDFLGKVNVGFRLWAGEGLHQMAEFHLTTKQIPTLLRLAWVRLKSVRRLMARTPIRSISAPDFKLRADVQNQNWIQELLKTHLSGDE
jgi:hypothetical protein